MDALFFPKYLKLLSGLLTNISAAYFMIATIAIGSTQVNMFNGILSFFYNLSIAIMYYLLAVYIQDLYE